ncbi:MAG: hypothetical protein GTO24_00050 [candidate division Zixibacteria bacterium]|nr:hypothetical protein [candidate division Zixibacteria bacterium]
MRVCLFGLTGFGNTTLVELTKAPMVSDVFVFTREEKGEFPYYDCEHLMKLCTRLRVKALIYEEMSSSEIDKVLKAFRPDMILVATFDHRIPGRIIDCPEMGAINIHPSLLPQYRGPTPTQWTIFHGEIESGVTFHLLDEQFDMGGILFQKSISIDGLIDGEVRRRLAQLSGEMLQPFLEMYVRGGIEVRAQRKDEGSYYPKVTSKEGIALIKSGRFGRDNLVRGLTPYPGIGILE